MEEDLSSEKESFLIPCGQQFPTNIMSDSVCSMGSRKRSCVDSGSGENCSTEDEGGYETVVNKKKALKIRRRLRDEAFSRKEFLGNNSRKALQSSKVFLSTSENTARKSDNGVSLQDKYFEVSVSSMSELPKPMAFAKLLSEQHIKNALRIVRKSAFKVLVRFASNEDAQSLITNAKCQELGYKCQMTFGGEVSLTYGIIKGVDIELSDQEIMNILVSETKIASAKRLKRLSEDGKWVNSESIRVCFESATLPSYVYAYECRFKVWKNVFPVSQCRGCWKFGHYIKYCPIKKILCPKCGGEHDNCNITEYNCLNCKGEHFVLDKSCPLFVKEKNIKEIMSANNLSYKRALQLYLQEKTEANEDHETQTFDQKSFEKQIVEDNCLEMPSTIAPRESYSVKVKKPKKTQHSFDHMSQIVSHPKVKQKRQKEQLKVQQNSTEDNSNKFELRNLLLKLKEIYLSEKSFELKLLSAVKVIFSDLKKIFCNFILSGDIFEGLLNCFNG